MTQPIGLMRRLRFAFSINPLPFSRMEWYNKTKGALLRNRIVFILLFYCTLFLTSCAVNPLVPLTIKNNEYNYEITFPLGWVPSDSQVAPSVGILGIYYSKLGSFSINVSPKDDIKDFENYCEAHRAISNNDDEYSKQTIVGESSGALQTGQRYRIITTKEINMWGSGEKNTETFQQAIHIDAANHYFTMYMSCFAEHYPQAEKDLDSIISSLKIF